MGLVVGWRLGIVAVFAALVGQALGIFVAFAIDDPLARVLEPRSFQLYEAQEGTVGVGIVFLGWFVGVPAVTAAGALSWFVRRKRSRKPRFPEVSGRRG